MASWYDRFQDHRIDAISRDAAASVAELGSAAGDAVGSNHGLIQNLFALDRAQTIELGHIKATLKVLVGMLVDAGVFDETVFQYRLEAEIDRFEAEQAEAEAEARKVQCYNCRQMVDPQRTQVDMTGTICDRCYHVSG